MQGFLRTAPLPEAGEKKKAGRHAKPLGKAFRGILNRRKPQPHAGRREARPPPKATNPQPQATSTPTPTPAPSQPPPPPPSPPKAFVKRAAPTLPRQPSTAPSVAAMPASVATAALSAIKSERDGGGGEDTPSTPAAPAPTLLLATLLTSAPQGVRVTGGARRGNFVRHNFKDGYRQRRKPSIVAARKKVWERRRGEGEAAPEAPPPQAAAAPKKASAKPTPKPVKKATSKRKEAADTPPTAGRSPPPPRKRRRRKAGELRPRMPIHGKPVEKAAKRSATPKRKAKPRAGAGAAADGSADNSDADSDTDSDADLGDDSLAMASLLHELRAAPDLTDDDVLRRTLQGVFGLSEFREGQAWAIKRVLQGKSTLLVAPTGTGKSLCYQLPAVLLPGLTLVVSPLISLMQDQMAHLPSCIRAACFTGKQTLEEMDDTLRRLRDRAIDILFVSPERLMTNRFRTLVANRAVFPPVSLACIDEAHCLSEWSHNFRPAYLRLRQALAEEVRAGAVLALTATATVPTKATLCSVLALPEEGVLSHMPHRPNLGFTANRVRGDDDATRALLKLVCSKELKHAKSIIVYVTTQAAADSLTDYLKNKGGLSARKYHGGMSSKGRARVQTAFMKGTVRIVVATVAFGMGIDKANVRAVIHYHLPRSLEDFVQQAGRAGRDGKPARCHVFLDEDQYRLLRALAHSDGVSTHQIHGLTALVWEAAATAAPGAAIIIPHRQLQDKLNLKPSVAETLLHCMQGRGLLSVEPSVWERKRNGAFFSRPQFVLTGVSPPEDKAPINTELRRITSALEERTVAKLDCVYRVLDAVATDDVRDALGAMREPPVAEGGLHAAIEAYFTAEEAELLSPQKLAGVAGGGEAEGGGEGEEEEEEEGGGGLTGLPVEPVSGTTAHQLAMVMSDVIHTLVAQISDASVSRSSSTAVADLVTGRAVAACMHGLSTPIFTKQFVAPGRSAVWGAYRHVDFAQLSALADKMIAAKRLS